MRRFVWATLAAGLCAGCPETYVEPEMPETLDPSVALYVTTELENAPRIHIRRLRSDVNLDCDQLALLPGKMAAEELDPALFDPGSTEHLEQGKRVAVPQRPGASCDLVRLELDTGKVFMATVRASQPETLTLTAEGLGGGYSLWPELARGHDANLERCSLAAPSPVRWSEPVPVGRALRIEALERNGACARMQLKNGYQWELCGGDAELPLAAGDVIDVGLNAAKAGPEWSHQGLERITIRIDRHARANDDTKLRIWVGQGPVAHQGNDTSQPNISVSHDQRCAVLTHECGMVSLPAYVNVILAKRSVQLRAGEQMRMAHEAGSLELTMGRLELVPIRAAACEDVEPRFVAVDRRRVREVHVAAEN